ncbi:LuxR C-terminal-related transcriptional regulator [Streptomyces sp. NPDC085665]|uniref:helix-turn-helix transcriptional regulator n=1 Tax=Streptomyces sp. NPDC085665 TaxID=3365735 RepID=UPI0037D702E2
MDLVEAAVRTGRRTEAAARVTAVREGGIAAISARLAMTVEAAAALTAPPRGPQARELFERALSAPGTDRWPFERARVRLAYGEHLRRARAATEPRPHLADALGTFRRLGARPRTTRAAGELRATGRSAGRTAEHADELGPASPTPRQREIARLAATGHTNKHIGERLHLSPRTVSTHLHQLFPKLGITSRAALRDALAELERHTPDDNATVKP